MTRIAFLVAQVLTRGERVIAGGFRLSVTVHGRW